MGHGFSESSTRNSPRQFALGMRTLIPLLLPEFQSLTPWKKAAFVAALTPSEKSFEKIASAAELYDSKIKAENIKATYYITIAHDEGNNKRKNLLLLYGSWRDTETKELHEPVLLGVLDTAKSGSENARHIKDSLDQLGIPPGAVVILCQTVDGAGAKVAAHLAEFGLKYTVVCEAHNTNGNAGTFDSAVAKSSPGQSSLPDFLFQLVHFIRKTVGIMEFLYAAARQLRSTMRTRGCPEETARKIVTVSERFEKENGLQRNLKVPQEVNRIRWNAIEDAAFWLSQNQRVLLDPSIKERGWLTEDQCSTIGVLQMGLHALAQQKKHVWYCKPSKDQEKYGAIPHIYQLAAHLDDPVMKGQLSLVAASREQIHQPALTLARSFEAAGGGACQQLKIQCLRLQLIQDFDISDDADWFKKYQPALSVLPDGAALIRNLLGTAQLYKDAMLKNTLEHIQRTTLECFPLVLGDPYLSQAAALLLFFNWEESEGRDHAEGGIFANLAPGAPWDTTLKTTTGEPIQLKATPQEIMVRCTQIFVEKDITKLVWWNDMAALEPGIRVWYGKGCPQSPLDEEFLSAFRVLLHYGLQPTRLTSLIVESGVNRLNKVDNIIGSSDLTQVARQTKMVVYERSHEILSKAKLLADKAKPVQKNTQKRAKPSLQTYMNTSHSLGKAELMCLIKETDDYANKSRPAMEAAVKDAEVRLTSAIKTEHDKEIVQAKQEKEIERHEGKADDFETEKAAAVASLSNTRLFPAAFGLVLLKGRSYLKIDMATTLARRYVENGTCTVANENAHTEALARETVPQLHERLRAEFFGAGWETSYAPKLMQRAEQDRAVEKAKAMSTPAMLADGTAWAWRSGAAD